MAPITLHLRSENKKLEHRSALTPSTVRELLKNGFAVNVERNPVRNSDVEDVEESPVRIFDDDEFKREGATLVKTGSWPGVPLDHIIIGLKELPEEKFPLEHAHIQFAHCYKGQGGWEEVLSRFPAGGGTLYDMEFLEDENRRRVAAFGYHAGFAGAALAIMGWAYQLEHGAEPMPGKQKYKNVGDLIKEVKTDLEKGLARTGGRQPQILVIGALGRCGGGALDLCKAVGVPDSSLIKWDLQETTAMSGPYVVVRESDIFINCIYLSADIPKFVTEEFLKAGPRRLSVVCDVSCDTTNPMNPIPFCNEPTSFEQPTKLLRGFDPPLSYITIDHLPSLLPREASEAFSLALLPSLLELKDRSNSRVWQKAGQLFREKVATLPPELQQAKGFVNGSTVPAVRP